MPEPMKYVAGQGFTQLVPSKPKLGKHSLQFVFDEHFLQFDPQETQSVELKK